MENLEILEEWEGTKHSQGHIYFLVCTHKTSFSGLELSMQLFGYFAGDKVTLCLFRIV